MKGLYGGITLPTEGWVGRQEGTDVDVDMIRRCKSLKMYTCGFNVLHEAESIPSEQQAEV